MAARFYRKSNYGANAKATVPMDAVAPRLIEWTKYTQTKINQWTCESVRPVLYSMAGIRAKNEVTSTRSIDRSA